MTFLWPAGLLGLATMPFGFDGFFWWLMGVGIDWMVAVAKWVAALPGAVGRMAAEQERDVGEGAEDLLFERAVLRGLGGLGEEAHRLGIGVVAQHEPAGLPQAPILCRGGAVLSMVMRSM